ncbi:hypothetical protein BpHYR1_034306 [Brachionus plicatilis]|uniref:Uncharacterized protein n=1 Tax=Brachionus plicatilis TaxID=10195 RepID=A0A3M7RUW4_BRAPC|nr:hypothetical protein BpHYR1_034306 [Brachionus plicatilis]
MEIIKFYKMLNYKQICLIHLCLFFIKRILSATARLAWKRPTRRSPMQLLDTTCQWKIMKLNF